MPDLKPDALLLLVAKLPRLIFVTLLPRYFGIWEMADRLLAISFQKR